MKELTHLKEAIEKHRKRHHPDCNSYLDEQLIEAAQSLVEALEAGSLGVVEWHGIVSREIGPKRQYWVPFPIRGPIPNETGHLFFLPAKSEGG